MEKDFKYRPFLYPNFDESLDEQYIQAKKRRKTRLIKSRMLWRILESQIKL